MSAREFVGGVGNAVKTRIASAGAAVEHAVNETANRIVSIAIRLGVGMDDDPPIPEARVVHDTKDTD
jgi:hypothetical protein